MIPGATFRLVVCDRDGRARALSFVSEDKRRYCSKLKAPDSRFRRCRRAWTYAGRENLNTEEIDSAGVRGLMGQIVVPTLNLTSISVVFLTGR